MADINANAAPVSAAAPVTPQDIIPQGTKVAAGLTIPGGDVFDQPAPPPQIKYTPTPEELASAKPAEPVSYTPTPQELATVQPAPEKFSPLQDLSVKELVQAAKDNPKEFDPVTLFQQLPASEQSQLFPKVADAYHELRQTGFYVPSATTMAKNVGSSLWDLAKTGAYFVRTATSFPMVEKAIAESEASGKPLDPSTYQGALALKAKQEAGEFITGQKMAGLGIGQTAVRAGHWLARTMGEEKSLKDYTPDEKNIALSNELATRSMMAKAAQSPEGAKSNFAALLTGKQGAPDQFAIRPEQVETYASGSPFVWKGVGTLFEGAGGLAKAVTPEIIPQTVSAATQAAARKVIGGAAQAVGATGEAAATGVKAAAPKVGAPAGVVAGAVAGSKLGPAGTVLGAMEGLEKGAKLGTKVADIADKTSGAFENLSQAGREVAQQLPATSRMALLGQDLAAAAPRVAKNLAVGTGLDVGLQAATAETPAEKENFTPFGTAFGVLGAGRDVGLRALSGQIVGPRDFGSKVRIASTGNFPGLAQLHDLAYNSAPEGIQRRVNALRGILAGVDPGAELFYVPHTEAGAIDPLTDQFKQLGLPEQWAQQGGVTPANQSFTGADGQQHRIVIARDIDAAPHEAIHANDNVIGAAETQRLNAQAKSQYGNIWDQLTQNYAEQVAGKSVGDANSFLLSATGKGDALAKEKIINRVAADLGDSGPVPTDQQIHDAAEPILAQHLAAAQAKGEALWQSELTPEEQKFGVDQIIGNEVRAENGDAWLKAGQDPNTLGGKMWRALADTVNFLGGNPVEGRTSEIQGIPLSYEQLRGIGSTVSRARPVVEPGTIPKITAPIGSPKAIAQNEERQNAIAAAAPEVALPGAAKSQAEMMGILNQARIAGTPVDVQYGHAPGAPAGGTEAGIEAALGSVPRGARRDVIETWRRMPVELRSFFSTLFSPEGFNLTKQGKFQVYGGAHAVFGANAQKLAEFKLAHPDFELPPELQVDPNTKSFTPAAWDSLFQNLQKYSYNQLRGRTGAGGELVVPKMKGYFPPPVTGEPLPISQPMADVINALYGTQTPTTARIAKADVLPLNLAGQRVAEATLPGRVEAPTAESPVFGEGGTKEAEQRAKGLGIAGEHVLTTNPFSARLNEFSDAPSFLEARQRLNLDTMADVNHAPGNAPGLRGNTLTLAAGFAPRKANTEVAKVKDDYLKSIGRPAAAPSTTVPVNPDLARRLADVYQNAVHSPESPEVRQSYDALANETLNQYAAMQGAGYKIEPWKGEGEPYANSAAMMDDVRDNKHLFYKPTETSFSGSQDNLMLRPAIGNTPVNDIFRAVHDFFGHAKEGYQFGPQGEFNAWREHSSMYSPEAQQALAAETLAQNSWVNFGRHLKGTETATEKPFAEQKNVLIPQTLIQEASAQFSPNPRAVKTAAVRDEKTGKVYEAPFHGGAMLKYLLDTRPGMSEDQVWDALSSQPGVTEGFTTHTPGEFLNRDEAFARAQELAQLPKSSANLGLESTQFERYKKLQEQGYNIQSGQFQPRREIEIEGPDGKKYRATFDGMQDFSVLGKGMVPQITALEDLPGGPVAKSTTYGPSLTAKGYKLPDLTAPPNAQFSPAGEKAESSEKPPAPEQIDRPVTMIVRHGSTSMNDPDPTKDRIRGWKDVPLDAGGLKEANETAAKLKPYGIDTVVTSDLKRTRQTADAIAKETGANVIDEPGFRPWHLGPTVEGKPTQEMLPVISDYARNPDSRPPGGETFNEFKNRFLDAFHRVQDTYPDQNAAIVTHYRGAKLLDAWRATGVDNDNVDMAQFEKYDPNKKPASFDVIDKTGAQFSPRKKTEETEPLVHFSNTPGLTTLEPEFHGTGLAGAESRRAKEYPELWVPRTYLGTKGYEKEPGLGDLRYRAEVRSGKIYDFQADPQNLYPSSEELEKAGYAPMDSRAAVSLYEKRIRDAGFEGYVNKDAKAVAKFTPTAVKPLAPGAAFSPTKEDFTDKEKLPNTLRTGRYAILTATQENRGKGTDEVNKIANENLEKALIADGFNPIPVSGSYKGTDQGANFIVPGMTPEQALQYGRNYGQESVALPEGLLYSDNSLQPADHTQTVVGPEAEKKDFVSKVEGGPAFSIGYDFDAPRKPLAVAESFLPDVPHGEIKGPVPVAITAPASRTRVRAPEEGRSLSADYVLRNPDMAKYAKAVVDHFKTLPGFRNVDTSDVPKAMREISNRLKDNIEFLYKKATPEERDKWRQWYDLANKMTKDWAPEYELNPDVIAAINARLSPQMDWDNNVTLTRAVLNTLKEDPKFTNADRLFLQEKLSKIKKAKERKRMETELAGIKDGQHLHELNDDQAGMLIRSSNELNRTLLTHNHNLERVGGKTGWSKPFDDLRSVVSIYRNPTPENVSGELGGNHKVRSFYNNHVAPESPDWATIDTHAVAAANLFSYGGKDQAVKKNFGGISHKASGYRGAYFLYQDAYTQAAKDLGILPRELQSVVWEKMRQLLTPEGKRLMQKEGVGRLEKIHSQMESGKLSKAKGREQILDLFESANSGTFAQPEILARAQR